MADRYILVAAIDFGTTFSGYAFSFETSKDDIRMNKNWGANIGFESYKTATSVLIGPNQAFKAFGFQAEKMYAEGNKKDSLFSKFKMALHNDKVGYGLDCFTA